MTCICGCRKYAIGEEISASLLLVASVFVMKGITAKLCTSRVAAAVGDARLFPVDRDRHRLAANGLAD